MTDYAIQADALGFSYGTHLPVLLGFDINIPRGTVYGLLGPNGCSKSTLFELLVGRSRFAAGKLEVLGLDPRTDYVDIRSKVGYVPQKNDLDPMLTLEQTLELFASFYGDRWNRHEAADWLRRFDLDRSKGKMVGTLSGGLRQRLALVTALAIEPEILLLDEPTTGLDAMVRREFTEAIIEYMAADPNRTVVISSHLLSEIEPLIDYVGLMDQGGNGMLVEASLADIKEKVLMVELESTAPATLTEHQGLISARWEGQASKLVFWLENSADAELLTREVRQLGGRVIEQSGLDDVFVQFFQGDVGARNARVLDGGLNHG